MGAHDRRGGKNSSEQGVARNFSSAIPAGHEPAGRPHAGVEEFWTDGEAQVTLAGIGGVIATSVTQRTREFGLRMALGAHRGTVLTMVLRQGLTLVAIGLVFGIAGALAAGRVLSAYLYQTAPRDPLIIAAVAAVFIIAGVLACLIPARRATTVDPLIALRAE